MNEKKITFYRTLQGKIANNVNKNNALFPFTSIAKESINLGLKKGTVK